MFHPDYQQYSPNGFDRDDGEDDDCDCEGLPFPPFEEDRRSDGRKGGQPERAEQEGRCPGDRGRGEPIQHPRRARHSLASPRHERHDVSQRLGQGEARDSILSPSILSADPRPSLFASLPRPARARAQLKDPEGFSTFVVAK